MSTGASYAAAQRLSRLRVTLDGTHTGWHTLDGNRTEI